MTLWPGWSWFVTPSGGPYAHPRSLGTLLMEAPLFAHAWGAWLAVGAFWGAGLRGGWHLWCAAVGLGVLWQAFNYERGAYGQDYGVIAREVGWRVLIGAVAVLPIWWLR